MGAVSELLLHGLDPRSHPFQPMFNLEQYTNNLLHGLPNSNSLS